MTETGRQRRQNHVAACKFKLGFNYVSNQEEEDMEEEEKEEAEEAEETKKVMYDTYNG